MAAANPLKTSIAEAVKANRRYENLFNRTGNRTHPRGEILATYRNYLRAIRQAKSRGAVQEVVTGMRKELEAKALKILTDAARIGTESAAAQLEAYSRQVRVKTVSAPVLTLEIENAMSAIRATLRQQAEAALALTAASSAVAMIAGTDARQGVIRPGPIVQALNFWSVSLGSVALLKMAAQASPNFQKQAIAVLDDRTTECCLEVHGQVVGLNDNFELTGEPRFDDFMEWSPFHWNAILAGEMCNTSKGAKPIECIKVGDMVLTHRGRYKPVTKALSRQHSGIVLKIETTGGTLKTTPEHPVLTARGWIQAKNLRKGDVVFGSEKLKESLGGLEQMAKFASGMKPESLDADRQEVFVSQDVFPPPDMVIASVELNAKMDLGKIKVKDVLIDRLLELEVATGNQAGPLEFIEHQPLEVGGVALVGLGNGDRSPLSHAGHVNRISDPHSPGCLWIRLSDPWMQMFDPVLCRGLTNSPAPNASLEETALDGVTGNAHIFGDHELGVSGSIKRNDGVGVDLNSSGHGELLYAHCSVISVTALELSDVTVCDLSVQDDESYCIAGHFVHNCRTSIALYQAGFDDGLTERMREGADYVLDQRQQGLNPTQAPASAFWENEE